VDLHLNLIKGASLGKCFKCFKCLGKGHMVSQCPNKRTMAVLVNGVITSASFSGSSSSCTESAGQCDVQPLKGDLLMVRRLIGSVCKD